MKRESRVPNCELPQTLYPQFHTPLHSTPLHFTQIMNSKSAESQPNSDTDVTMQPQSSQIESNDANNNNNSMVYARKRARKAKTPTKLGSKKRPRILSSLSHHISSSPSQDDDVQHHHQHTHVPDDDDDDDVFLVFVDSNGTKSDSLWCHQCQKSYKGRVVKCTMCKSNQFCIPCIKTRYPLLKEEEIARACPVCLNKCNCMACLRTQVNGSLETSSKGKMYNIRNQSSLLPIPKECNKEQMIGKEQMTKIRDISSQQYTSVKEVRVDEAVAEKQLTESPLLSLIRSSNQEGPTQTSEVGPTQTSHDSIQSLFNLPMEDWVRESIINGVKTILDIISNYESTKSLLADQARIFRSLTIINSIINSAGLRTTEISWLSSKVKDVVIAAEEVAKMEILVDTKQLKALLSEQANCVSEISGLRVGLSEMSHKSLELKQEENELLKEEARIRQMRESFLGKKKKLVVEMNEVRFSLDQKIKEKERLDSRLEQAGIVKLKDVEKENGRLKNLINDVISFSKLC